VPAASAAVTIGRRRAAGELSPSATVPTLVTSLD
jgi:hypothetical protein